MLKVNSIASDGVFKKARMNLDIIILPIAFVFVVVLMSISTSFKFLSFSNISSMLLQLPELGLFSLAMMQAMTIGGIDLSIISTANLSGVMMAWLLTNALPADASGGALFMYIGLIIIAGLLISLILGFVNGLLIAYVEVSPTLATLSTMILYEGLTLAITRGKVISGLPDMFTAIGNGSLLGIPVPFIIFVICAFVLRLMVKRTPMGKYQVLIGSNKKAVEFSGIDVRKITVKTHMICSFLAGMASVIMISRLNSANARFGTSYQLLAILICVLGGTDPQGGYVRVGGVIAALFTMQALNSGINILGISPFISTSLWGILLVSIIAYRRYIAQKKDKFLSDMAKNE